MTLRTRRYMRGALVGIMAVSALVATGAQTANATPVGGSATPSWLKQYLAPASATVHATRPTAAQASSRALSPALVPQASAADFAAGRRPTPEPARADPPNPDGVFRLPTLPPTAARPTGGVQPNTTGYGSFAGISNTSWGPADPSSASSSTNVVETVNEALEVFNRGGGGLYRNTLQNLFGVSASTSVFDPHVIYEPVSNRFVVVADDGHNWRVLITSSNTFTAGWCTYAIPAQNNSSQFPDFPLIGADYRNIYLTMNELNGGGGNRVVALNRSQMDTCSSVGYLIYTNIPDPGTGGYAQSIAPALVYNYYEDANEYFVDSYGGGGSHVTLGYVNASDNVIYSKQVSVPTYGKAGPAPQRGASGRIDTDDAHIFQAVEYRFGLYAALTYSCSWSGKTASCIEWFKFDPSPGIQVLNNAGAFGYPGDWFFYPSMGQDYNGDAMFTFALSSSAFYPSSGSMSMNLTGQYGADYFLHQGAGPYTGIVSNHCTNCYRWGDYSSAFTDIAVNANRFYITDQTAIGSNHWGTEIGQAGP